MISGASVAELLGGLRTLLRTRLGYLDARAAAEYVGFRPGPERDADGNRVPARKDLALRAFWHFVRKHHVPVKRAGKLARFRAIDLELAVERSTDEHGDKVQQMEELGRRHASGEDIRREAHR